MPTIAIMAAPRPTPNVHSTLAGMMFADDRARSARKVVGYDAPDADAQRELGIYGDSIDVVVPLFASTNAESEMSKSGPACRARWNYIRMLRASLRETRAVIAIEDDLAFARRWFDALELAAMEFPNCPILGYERHPREAIDDVKVLREGVVGDYRFPWLVEHEASHSTLCVWWPRAMVEGVIEVLERSIHPIDVTLDRWMRQREIRPISLWPSIVDHRGDVSLINPNDGVRRAANFGGHR